MPSLFARQRRASESMPNDIPPPGLQSKRKSMDAGRPPVSGNKFKSLFSHGKEEEKTVNGRRSSLSQIFGDEEGSGSLRKRLSNASQIFHKSNEPQQQLTPTTPRVNGERSPSLGTFASPNLFPENFALSSTTSPETAGRRGSASWQPSYPTVLAEDAYPDLAPDGHPATQQLASSPKLPSENQFRRSLHAIPTPSPDEQPVRPFTPPKGPAPLPTPPPSATSPCRTLPRETDFPVDARGAQSQTPDPFTAPEVHEVSKAELGLTESPKDESQSATSTAAPTKPSQRPILSLVTNNETAEPSSVTPVDQSPIDTPSSARRNPRPIGMPPRRTTLIQSPPMPQPIKNLPSMVGWPAFMRDGVPGTPGWGASGSKTPGWSGGNAPKTPGWSSLVTSPTSARPPSTPGGTGFPFSLPQTSIGQNKGKGRESMTEEDLRKARRAMPVMLREPSFKPPENDGGEVGASDEEDEESETEVEGHDDDSEPETEVEKAKKPAVPLRNRLRGNTKSKPVSALAHSAVQEEEATTPPARPEATRNGTQKKSFWSLATPVKQPASWTSFSSSPSATPIADNRPESSAASENAEGYFSSNPSRSTLGTPRTLEPVLTKSGPVQQDAGLNRLIAAQAQADSSARADSPGSDGDASDGGSDESEGTSNDHNHVSAAPAAQINTIPESRPDAPKRPSFYTRQSRSMVNLAAEEREAPSTGTQLTTIKSREPAPGKIEMPTRSGPLAMMTPGWAKPPPTPAAGRAGFFWQKSKDGQEIGTLKRRRSADDMTATPPMYEPPFPGTYIPRPRDEEGKEKLPKYWCAVHIEGNMSRKMEFSSPGVQSRDRSWKKQYFIIHGTSLSVYRFDPHRFPLKAEPAQPIPSVTEDDSEEYLHVHCPGERRQSVTIASPQSGRRGSLPDTSAPRRTSVSSQTGSSRRTSISSVPSPLSTSTTISEKDPALFPNTGRRSSTSSTGSNHVGSSSIASHFQQNQLVKQYTLQNAESGLAADYVKRKNVVRVRAEGEQFLLQTDSARDVVDWIEAFQAATNVSLDLDERPMPKIITLPRRRRRRVPGTAGASGAATPANGDANPRTSDTPEGNAAAVASATRASRDRERMLAEDQASGTAAG